jgi:hypothetical protein
MAAPSSLRVRAYNVGFGDCILLSFGYPDGSARHALVDFGSTKLPAKGASLTQVAEHIRTETDGHLAMVAATHRHADHISGFAGEPGKIVARLAPRLVVQPWTEDPDLAPDATAPASAPARPGSLAAAVARLDTMHAYAASAVAEYQRRLTAGDRTDLLAAVGFLGEVNLKNAAAVRTLQQMGEQRLYARFGDVLPLDDALPGVRIDVLGPPTLDQAAGLVAEARTDPDEYWHVATSTLAPSRAKGLFPRATVAAERTQEARWLAPRVDRLRTEELLSIVRTIDDALNNTSLILLVTIGATSVLLAGDAQLENWSYALRDAPDAAAIRARLAGCRLYKVGHHGSLNATPKTMLWQNFGTAARPEADKLITVLSTLAGKHGSPARGTEVPRRPLVDALRAESTLLDTRSATKARFWVDTTIEV